MINPTYGDVRKRLRKEGWYIARQKGSHEQWKHPDYPARRVTVAGADSDRVPPKTWKDIQSQAGW